MVAAVVHLSVVYSHTSPPLQRVTASHGGSSGASQCCLLTYLSSTTACHSVTWWQQWCILVLSTHIPLLHYSGSQHYMVAVVVHLSVVYSHNSPPLQRVTTLHGGSGGASQCCLFTYLSSTTACHSITWWQWWCILVLSTHIPLLHYSVSQRYMVAAVVHLSVVYSHTSPPLQRVTASHGGSSGASQCCLLTYLSSTTACHSVTWWQQWCILVLSTHIPLLHYSVSQRYMVAVVVHLSVVYSHTSPPLQRVTALHGGSSGASQCCLLTYLSSTTACHSVTWWQRWCILVLSTHITLLHYSGSQRYMVAAVVHLSVVYSHTSPPLQRVTASHGGSSGASQCCLLTYLSSTTACHSITWWQQWCILVLSTHIPLLHYSVSQRYMVAAVVHLSVVYSHTSPPLQRVTALHGGSGGASQCCLLTYLSSTTACHSITWWQRWCILVLSTHIPLLHYSGSQHYMMAAVVHLSVVYSHNSPPLQRVTTLHGGSGGASQCCLLT